MTKLAPANEELPSRTAFAAEATLLTCAASFVTLFTLMWGPVYFGNEGWLLLNPIFLLAWVPIELGAIGAVILGLISVFHARPGRRGRRRAWLAIIGGIGLALLSLPVLWFGNLPQVLFMSGPCP